MKELHGAGYSENFVEDYADFYFRSFPPPESSKPKIEEMRKKENIHKSIHRYMECYAELKECEINNKNYNLQRGKYMKGKDKEPEPAAPAPTPTPTPAPTPTATTAEPTPAATGGNSEALQGEVKWLNSKIEELHEEIKRQAKLIRKA